MAKLISSIWGLFSIIIIIFLIIFLDAKNFLELPKSILYFSALSVSRPINWLTRKTANSIEFIISLKNLSQDNEALWEKNLFLLSENVRLKELERENGDLRKMLDLNKSRRMNLLLAEVTNRDPQNLGDYFSINEGEEEGVKPGMAVITSEGFLVGKVEDVSSHFSKVMLVSNSQNSLSVVFQDSRAMGLLEGKHGIGLLVDLVPQEEKIKKGEMVLTSGLGNFPKGLIIGEVIEIKSQDSQVFQQIRVQPIIDIRKIENVFIIRDF